MCDVERGDYGCSVRARQSLWVLQSTQDAYEGSLVVDLDEDEEDDK